MYKKNSTCFHVMLVNRKSYSMSISSKQKLYSGKEYDDTEQKMKDEVVLKKMKLETDMKKNNDKTDINFSFFPG